MNEFERRQQIALREYQTRLGGVIKKNGWAVQGVFPTEGSPEVPFVYTIGMTSHHLPELIMSGDMGPNLMTNLLNDAARRHLDKALAPGDLVEGVANIVFRVRACGPDAPVQQARNYFLDYEATKVKVLQLIWPEENGAYPDQFVWSGELDQVLF